MIKTFNDLDFKIIEKDDLTEKELKDMLKEIKQADLSAADCLVLVAFTCGMVNGSSPAILASNGIFYSVDTLQRKLNKHPQLLGKPKILLMVLNQCSKQEFLYKADVNPVGVASTEGTVSFQKQAQGANMFTYYVDLKTGSYLRYFNHFCIQAV